MVDSVLYYLATALAKVAILIFLHRIFSIDTRFRWFSIFVAAIIFLWGLISALITIFACSPIIANYKYSYQLAHPGGFKCMNVNMVILYYGWFNTVTDFVLLLLPMPLIWKMNMAIGRKIGVAIVFGSGLL